MNNIKVQPQQALQKISIEPLTWDHIRSFRDCLDLVARERRWLAMLEAPPLEDVRNFIEQNIQLHTPQYVALLGEEVVGWCDITPLRREGFHHTGRLGMGIHHAWRGLGLGRRLIETTLLRAQSDSLRRVELEVFATNTRAIALYERTGFVLEGRKRKIRYLDGAYDDVMFMARLFDESP